MANVNPEPRTVDQHVDGSIARASVERNRPEPPSAPGERRVIRNGKTHLEVIGQRTQEAFSLPERQVEDHADRQSRLDRDIRVDALPAGFATKADFMRS